jgi:plastocyanin
MRATTLSFSVLIVSVFFLTACAAPARTTSVQMQVTISPDRFTPTQWRIPGGETIQLQIINQTADEHEWVLLKDPPKEPYGTEEEAQVLVRIRVAGGETRSAQFRAPAAPGEYSATCSIPGHLEKGEIGKVVVVQPGY